MSLFAPGIPASKNKSKIPIVDRSEDWDFVIHKHKAKKAGEHYDLRLSDGKRAYSWAIRKGLPDSSKKRLAVRQPDHTPEYMDFSGKIESGYGAGKVKISDKGKARIIKSDSNKIIFNILNKKIPEEYILINKEGDKWLLINNTQTIKKNKDVVLDKPKYKELEPSKIGEILDDNLYAIQPKIDGSHIILKFIKKKYPKAFSYRKPARSDKLINHTYKIENLDNVVTPESLDNTIIRAELAATDGRNILPANELAGILNSTTENSIKTQKKLNIRLRPYLFAVDKFLGEDVSSLPYRRQLLILDKAKRLLNSAGVDARIPDTAFSRIGKEVLFSEIKSGKRKDTREGVVAINKEDPQEKIKIKIRPDYDVVVREIYPQITGKDRDRLAGGFRYSFTPRGPIIGNIGTGLTRKLKEDMIKNPKKYIGLISKARALGIFPSGKLRAPSHTGWHLDKNITRDYL